MLQRHQLLWNLTRRSRVRFQIFLWCLKAKFQIPLSAEACLRLTPLSTRNYHSKAVEFDPNSHIFFEICENLAKTWCLSQTPQILSQTPQMLVKFHTFWVDDLGGEWCYAPNFYLRTLVLQDFSNVLHSFTFLCSSSFLVKEDREKMNEARYKSKIWFQTSQYFLISW